MKRLAATFFSSLIASVVYAQAEGVPPGPPTVEVTGTVDANVVNTPLDVNVVEVQPPKILQVAPAVVALNNLCPAQELLYTVPDGYRLKIVDAYANANLSSPNFDNIVADAGAMLSLRWSCSDGVNQYACRVSLAHSNEIPLGGARTVEAYADPNSEIFLSIEGCTQNQVNARGGFIGQLTPVGN